MRGRLPAHPPFPAIDRTGHLMSATAAVTRPIESGRRLAAVRGMGSRSSRHHGAALSRRPLSQPRIFRLDRRAVLGPARRLALRRDGGGHDLRDRQPGARSLGRLDLRLDGGDLRHGFRADLFRLRRLDRGLLVPRAWSCCRAHQRVSGHDPRGARLHRHPDDAVHRPRRDPRSHRRQEHRLRAQGR